MLKIGNIKYIFSEIKGHIYIAFHLHFQVRLYFPLFLLLLKLDKIWSQAQHC